MTSLDDDVFGDSFKTDRERGGTEPKPEVVAPPQPQTPPQPETPTPVATPPAAPPGNQPSDATPPASGHVNLLPEMLAERKKFYEKLESQATEAGKREAEYQRKLDDALKQLESSKSPPPAPPDPNLDPAGHIQHVVGKLERDSFNRFLNISESMARRAHGDASLDEAKKAAIEAGIIRDFSKYDDPYEVLMKWHKRQKAVSTVGDDLEAYNKRIGEAAVAKALEELKKTGGAGGSPPSFPGSLSDATGSRTQGGELMTAQGAMNDVFARDRKRKG